MSPAAYSGKSQIEKLGFKPFDKVYLYRAPQNFYDYLGANEVTVAKQLPADWALGFFSWHFELERFLKQTKLAQIKNGLWVSWPKKASGQKTDLSEQTFRDLILPLGWVDTKVSAIDDTWSGLKFLRRKNS